MVSKISQNLRKNELETKSTKNAKNVLNLIPLDLQETRFRMEGLSKITKTRGADKYRKNIKKLCRNEAKIHEKSVPELNKKRSSKTEPQKSKNIQKMTRKWYPKSDFLSRVLPLVAPLVAQTVSVIKKWASGAPKVRPRLEK